MIGLALAGEGRCRSCACWANVSRTPLSAQPDKLSQFSELWSQKNVAVLNAYEVELAKLKGEFVRHTHEDTDELIMVISERPTLQLRDGDVVLEPGELFVVPRGVEHCPVAVEETEP
ncbi:cupin domain-containing protein [Streptomyces sp. NPDC088348]|uniref:cupin domain-containing protein n=1 Tax=Streptomyces sp. NPDC088348 TaxID=3365853 RepID=UPI00380356A0